MGLIILRIYTEGCGTSPARDKRVYRLGCSQLTRSFYLKGTSKTFGLICTFYAGPTGFYREVNESTVQSSSFTEPLWRAIGLDLSSVSTVCQQVGSGTLENVPFLDADANTNESSCLPGLGNNFIFPDPLFISLGIRERVQVPDDLIGRRLSVILVTGTCQNPVIRSEPVIITGKISRESDVVHQNLCTMTSY